MRWLHYMRKLVTNGVFYVHLCKTHEMLANALTKVENRAAFFVFRRIAMNMDAKK